MGLYTLYANGQYGSTEQCTHTMISSKQKRLNQKCSVLPFYIQNDQPNGAKVLPTTKKTQGLIASCGTSSCVFQQTQLACVYMWEASVGSHSYRCIIDFYWMVGVPSCGWDLVVGSMKNHLYYTFLMKLLAGRRKEASSGNIMCHAGSTWLLTLITERAEKMGLNC